MKTEFKRSEHSIQTEIINFLRGQGWYVMRLNSGKYSVGEGVSKRFILGQEAGTPDIVALKYAKNSEVYFGRSTTHTLFVEVKVPGKSPTALQRAKMEELTQHGARCIVAHSREELEGKI